MSKAVTEEEIQAALHRGQAFAQWFLERQPEYHNNQQHIANQLSWINEE